VITERLDVQNLIASTGMLDCSKDHSSILIPGATQHHGVASIAIVRMVIDSPVEVRLIAIDRPTSDGWWTDRGGRIDGVPPGPIFNFQCPKGGWAAGKGRKSKEIRALDLISASPPGKITPMTAS
jgi:hypothetical protein